MSSLSVFCKLFCSEAAPLGFPSSGGSATCKLRLSTDQPCSQHANGSNHPGYAICLQHRSEKLYISYGNMSNYTLCARWCTHFSARRRRHISKTHYCQGGCVNEDAKTHFEDTLNEDEFPPEDDLPSEDTLRRHIKRRRISPRRRITPRRHISKTH